MNHFFGTLILAAIGCAAWYVGESAESVLLAYILTVQISIYAELKKTRGEVNLNV